jgi:formiminotetrahydrofolate cyclodeaminase
MSLGTFAREVASDKPVPGGGSVSAYTATLAAGLVAMVCRITLKKLENESDRVEINAMLKEAEDLQSRLLSLVDEDSKSFASLMDAYRLPKSTEEEKKIRSAQIQVRLKVAADVPLATAENSSRTFSLANGLAKFANQNIISDLQTSAHLAYAATIGALANVEINLASIKDEEYNKETRAKVDEIRNRIEKDRSDTLLARNTGIE